MNSTGYFSRVHFSDFFWLLCVPFGQSGEDLLLWCGFLPHPDMVCIFENFSLALFAVLWCDSGCL